MLLALTMMAAEAKPDLIIESITPICLEPGLPGIQVVVKNNSADIVPGPFWVDLYRGLGVPPAGPPFPAGERWEQVPAGLGAFATYTWKQEYDNYPGWSGWVDAVADTFDAIFEDNEGNNVGSTWLTIPSC
jgi:hypothetical protein